MKRGNGRVAQPDRNATHNDATESCKLVHFLYFAPTVYISMEFTSFPPPSVPVITQRKMFKKRKGTSVSQESHEAESTSVERPSKSPRFSNYARYHPLPHIPKAVRIVIPGPVRALPPSAEPIHNQELCRHNYGVIMRKMFHCSPRQERLVEIQMIKKPGSFLNMYFPYFGHVVLPVLELPTTFTVWVVLDLNRKLIRVPLDHFLIVNKV